MALKVHVVDGETASGDEEYTLIIAGGGPAALSAALYGARYGIDHLVLESWQPGGQAALTAEIENYPGFLKIAGSDLAAAMKDQAVKAGAVFRMESVETAEQAGESIRVKTDSNTYRCNYLIIATGAAPATLGVPGEKQFYGRGVSFCATCDAPFFKGRKAIVVGGGDSAVKEALHLADVVSELGIVHRRDRFRAEPYLSEKLLNHEKVTPYWNSHLRKVVGDQQGVTAAVIETPEGELEIPTDGVFLYVGTKPATGPFTSLVELDKRGAVITENIVATSNPKVFAAGDVTNNGFRQVVTAVSDGARAAAMIFEELQKY
ncbi:thioredoxin-disulfide reductase [Candidatus Fermentibacteria bacterium]|nr:MAG: thioredoxin-disulfide reductase [Candidatus Fermentibacteria bacterium]